jgi:hypothetical protein
MQCSKCKKPARTRGLCGTHYQAAWRKGNLEDYAKTGSQLPDHCEVCSLPRVKGRWSSRFCRYHRGRATNRYLTKDLDQKTGLFSDEDPSVLGFKGNGNIICLLCRRATSEHGNGEFCFSELEELNDVVDFGVSQRRFKGKEITFYQWGE